MFHPNSLKNKIYFKDMVTPKKNWQKFRIVKIIMNGDEDTCHQYNFSSDNSQQIPKTSTPNGKSILKPAPPVKRKSGEITDSNGDVHDDDDEDIIKRRKTLQEKISKAAEQLSEGSCDPRRSPRNKITTERRNDRSIKFPMEEGKFSMRSLSC